MRIIVCGAGSVGQSIVSYLVKGNNDIAVIDHDQRRLDELSREFDVLPVLGEAAHPDVLERAKAGQADLILAVTDVDEINMSICQIAYSLFNIPRKIARLESEVYLDPIWGELYNDKHLPVDLIISPAHEIAENILNILRYSGSSGILPVLQDKGCVLTLKLAVDCPLLNIPLTQLIRQLEDVVKIAVISVTRDNRCFIPEGYDSFMSGDEVNIFVNTDEVYNVISAFGLEKPANERILIFGGNAIATYMGKKLEQDDTIVSSKVIEEDLETARRLAKDLPATVVIHGEMLSDVILDEADISHTDAAVAVTENDKDNLLDSLLAAKCGVSTTLAVINTPSYNNLIFNIGGSILVDSRAVTISKMLKELRRADIRNAYAVSHGNGEIWEIEVQAESLCSGKKIGELNLPRQSRIFLIRRDDTNIYPDPTTVLTNGDTLLLYTDSMAIREVENIFT